jgi:uncharacterized protein YutE (UPF0331/DUF86 family)
MAARECIETHYAKNPNLSAYEIAKLCNCDPSYVYRVLDKITREAKRLAEEISEKGLTPSLKREVREETRRFVGTGISEVLKALGREYAETIEKLSEKRSWFTAVLVDLGFESMLMAFQYAKVDPKDVLRKVEEFDDPDKFKEFVRRHLAAMIEASADAVKAIVERDKRIRQYENALRVLSAISAGLKKTVDDLTLKLNMAEMLISKYNLQEEYVNTLMQANIIHALTRIPLEVPQPREAVVVESKGKSEG